MYTRRHRTLGKKCLEKLDFLGFYKDCSKTNILSKYVKIRHIFTEKWGFCGVQNQFVWGPKKQTKTQERTLIFFNKSHVSNDVVFVVPVNIACFNQMRTPIRFVRVLSTLNCVKIKKYHKLSLLSVENT